MSCASSLQKLEVVNQPAQIERSTYARPSGVAAPDISSIVITPDRAAEWNKQVAAGERAPYVIFGHDEQNYLTFSQWLQDVLRYIKSQNAIIAAYENDAQQHNDKLRESEQ